MLLHSQCLHRKSIKNTISIHITTASLILCIAIYIPIKYWFCYDTIFTGFNLMVRFYNRTILKIFDDLLVENSTIGEDFVFLIKKGI